MTWSRADLVTLLQRVADRDRTAFSILYQRTNAKLFGICIHVCANSAAAEDVLAEVYITIWKSAGEWDPHRGSPITWLAAIARNRAIDWRRANRPTVELSAELIETLVDPGQSSFDLAQSRNFNVSVAAELDRLLIHVREAIRSAFFDGSTYAELALQAGVPLGTMKSWVRRGLATIKQEMTSNDADWPDPYLPSLKSPRPNVGTTLVREEA